MSRSKHHITSDEELDRYILAVLSAEGLNKAEQKRVDEAAWTLPGVEADIQKRKQNIDTLEDAALQYLARRSNGKEPAVELILKLLKTPALRETVFEDGTQGGAQLVKYICEAVS